MAMTPQNGSRLFDVRESFVPVPGLTAISALESNPNRVAIIFSGPTGFKCVITTDANGGNVSGIDLGQIGIFSVDWCKYGSLATCAWYVWGAGSGNLTMIEVLYRAERNE